MKLNGDTILSSGRYGHRIAIYCIKLRNVEEDKKFCNPKILLFFSKFGNRNTEAGSSPVVPSRSFLFSKKLTHCNTWPRLSSPPSSPLFWPAASAERTSARSNPRNRPRVVERIGGDFAVAAGAHRFPHSPVSPIYSHCFSYCPA